MTTTGLKEFINRGVLPLVGRRHEIRILTDAFNGLLEGEPRAVWINGVAGTGKSRLVEELKSRARDNAARALVAHAKWYEGYNGEFAPLSTALESLRPALSAPAAARIYRDGVVSSIEAAVETVQIASRRYPIVLVLDDLHYLESTAELEKFINALEGTPLLIVATTRPADTPALRAVRNAISGIVLPAQLEIGALDKVSIAEAVTTLFGAAPSQKMLDQIASLCNGLPLTLREVLRELIAAEVLVGAEDGQWRWSTDRLKDDRLRTLGERVHGFSGRLASLPDTKRSMLAIAAFLGEQFNRDLLRALCERTSGWDAATFEELILDGLIAIATPSIRFASGDTDTRAACYAFFHTLLWNAAESITTPSLPSRARLAGLTLEILGGGTGELYGISALQHIEAGGAPAEGLPRAFDWLGAVGRRLSSIYSDLFVSLCHILLEPSRRGSYPPDPALRDHYLPALTAYGGHLNLSGLRAELDDVAREISVILEDISAQPPRDAADRIMRLEAAVVVWHNALLLNQPDAVRGQLDQMLQLLPVPAMQTDRELRCAAEAIRLRAQYSFAHGDFAGMLDVVSPYIGELDRMRPETLNELFKVSLYTMMSAGRTDDARQMVEAGLRSRKDADVFTEYQLLLHAANYAGNVNDIGHIKQYATELRSLADRHTPYRNMSANYYHLPYVAAVEADLDELEKLESDFRDTPPPPRSTPVQTAIARQQFTAAWNLLARPDRAAHFVSDLQADQKILTPHQQMRVVEEEVRAAIDAADKPAIRATLVKAEALATQIGGEYLNAESDSRSKLNLLKAIGEGDIQGLKALTGADHADTPTDAFRAAHMLLAHAGVTPPQKRELTDAALAWTDRGVQTAIAQSAIALAHYLLDAMTGQLPKTRLAKFRQLLGPDPRALRRKEKEEEQAGLAGTTPTTTTGRTLRTFGALRMEGVGESGAKLESKTRTLVAAMTVSRLGRSRELGELTRDRMADLLWPDMELDRAVNNLHATTSYARRFLGGPDTIVQQDGVYQLAESLPVDALEFLETVDRGNKLYAEGVYFGAAVAYRRAVDIAIGDFLEGMYTEWVDNMRESMRGKLATALERLIGIEADRENFQAVPALAERLLALDDLHDGAYEALIRSAALRGARREAFSYYKRYQTTLDAYGAGPTRRITELMKQVREGEEMMANP